MTPYELMLKDTKRSGLDEETTVDRLGFKAYTNERTEQVTKGKYTFRTYKIPYFDKEGNETKFSRLRSLETEGGFFTKDGNWDGRYWQAKGTPPHLYMSPQQKWDRIAKDPSIPIVLTEGEKKAAASNKFGIVTLALGGVWMFGSKKKDIFLLEEFEDFNLADREMEICYDGDQCGNSHVRFAMRELARRLTEKRARVSNVILPSDMKLDDLLVSQGLDAYRNCPREHFNPKAQISMIRSAPKLKAHERKEKVAEIAQQSLLATGSAHMVGAEPIVFNRDERRVFSFLVRDDSQTRSFLNDVYGLNPAGDDYNFVHEHIRAHIIRHGAQAQAATFAHFDKKGGVLRISLGGPRVFRVDRSGDRYVKNGGGNVFFRDFSAAPVEPANGSESALEFVLSSPNFQGGDVLSVDQQKMMWELHFWSLFFPNLLPTRPLMVLHGIKGSAKTSAAVVTGKGIFGPDFEVQAVDQDKMDDVDVSLIHNPYVVLDNLDGYFKKLRNKLAIASTGGTIPRRVLYTTMEEVKFKLQARIVATSRDPSVFVRDDLRDRSVLLKLARRERFIPQEQVYQRVERNRPAMWGHILETLPKIIAAITDHKSRPRAERLADFAQFCIAVGPTVGYKEDDVEDALKALEGERNAFASSRSTLLEALQIWAQLVWKEMDGRDQWKRKPEDRSSKRGSTSELFASVSSAWSATAQSRHRPFPFHTPESFGMALRDDEGMLSDYFEVTREQGRSRTTIITIRPKYNLEREKA